MRILEIQCKWSYRFSWRVGELVNWRVKSFENDFKLNFNSCILNSCILHFEFVYDG